MSDHVTVGMAARIIERRTGNSVPPHLITNLFYKRYLDQQVCPLVGRFRLIPENYIPEIERVLRERGILLPSASVPQPKAIDA